MKDEEKRLFAEFLCMTKLHRVEYFQITTQDEFAKKYGVNPKTLSEWKKEPRFIKMKRDMQRNLAADKLPDLLEALSERALGDRDVSAIREYLKYLGESIDRTEEGISENTISIILDIFIEVTHEHVKDSVTLDAISNDLKTKLSAVLKGY
jgi:DNA-binding XRE family transcriptional regulator